MRNSNSGFMLIFRSNTICGSSNKGDTGLEPCAWGIIKKIA